MQSVLKIFVFEIHDLTVNFQLTLTYNGNKPKITSIPYFLSDTSNFDKGLVNINGNTGPGNLIFRGQNNRWSRISKSLKTLEVIQDIVSNARPIDAGGLRDRSIYMGIRDREI